MRWVSVVMLWLIAVALGVADYRERRAGVPAETAPAASRAEGESRRLVGQDADAVRGIRIVDGDLVVRLDRHGEDWRVAGPAGAAVPADLGQAFAEALLDATVLDTAASEEDRTVFGLDESRAIEVEFRDGSRRRFVVGAETPTGTAAYVREGSGPVLVVGRNLVVYRDLLLEAVRPAGEPSVPVGPVAGKALTQAGKPG